LDSQSTKSLNLWLHIWGDVAIGAPIGLRVDFDGATLTRLERVMKNVNQRRRLLSLTEIYDGISRSYAAQISGVVLQIGRGWVVRFNSRSLDGLIDGKPAPDK
jgi:hypothetical protein